MTLKIYTDGSCLGNPGPGGWAALLRDDERVHRIQGGEPYTTNNRMELLAVIEALRYVEENLHHVKVIEIYSDSVWVISTITKNWKRKKNLDLWAQLAPLLQDKKITWHWVKGHAGHPENEDCDQRAQKEARSQEPYNGPLPEEQPGLFGSNEGV